MDLPTSMRAAYVTELGGPDTIRYGDLPVPQPGAHEVLICAAGIGVDPVDTFVRSGSFPTQTPFPFIVGRDVSGTVAAVGDRVHRFAVGDRVWCNSLGHGGRQGAAAEYALASVDRVYPLPEGVDPITAAAAVHPAATAYLASDVHGRLRSGQTLYVGGGAGHVGSALIRIGREAGARVLTSASSQDTDYCIELGAEQVIDYHRSDVTDQLTQLAPGGIDLAVDTSGNQDPAALISTLALGGRMVTMAGMGATTTLNIGSLYTRDRSLIGFAISNAGVDDLRAAAAYINPMLARAALQPREISRMPLSDAAHAHDQLERGQTRARMVLQP
jgi:NADPH:quinone reductase-like Zn-dependent oxidoreductase